VVTVADPNHPHLELPPASAEGELSIVGRGVMRWAGLHDPPGAGVLVR
jgi:hypothetical protein